MKSKVKFDLNGHEKAVISAEIVYTDDVRDKIARNFFEKLGYESNLAFVEIHPEGSVQDTNPNGGNYTGTFKVKRIHIIPFSGNESGSVELCKQLCFEQLRELTRAATAEIERRTLQTT